jgi:hypothetical protein
VRVAGGAGGGGEESCVGDGINVVQAQTSVRYTSELFMHAAERLPRWAPTSPPPTPPHPRVNHTSTLQPPNPTPPASSTRAGAKCGLPPMSPEAEQWMKRSAQRAWHAAACGWGALGRPGCPAPPMPQLFPQRKTTYSHIPTQ